MLIYIKETRVIGEERSLPWISRLPRRSPRYVDLDRMSAKGHAATGIPGSQTPDPVADLQVGSSGPTVRRYISRR